MKKILLLGLRHWSTSSSIHQSRNAFTPIYHTCPYQIPASTNIVQPQLDHSEYVKLGLYSSRVDLIKTREWHNICLCKTVRKLKISTSTCTVCHRDMLWFHPWWIRACRVVRHRSLIHLSLTLSVRKSNITNSIADKTY